MSTVLPHLRHAARHLHAIQTPEGQQRLCRINALNAHLPLAATAFIHEHGGHLTTWRTRTDWNGHQHIPAHTTDGCVVPIRKPSQLRRVTVTVVHPGPTDVRAPHPQDLHAPALTLEDAAAHTCTRHARTERGAQVAAQTLLDLWLNRDSDPGTLLSPEELLDALNVIRAVTRQIDAPSRAPHQS